MYRLLVRPRRRSARTNRTAANSDILTAVAADETRERISVGDLVRIMSYQPTAR